MEKPTNAVISKEDVWNILLILRQNWYIFALVISSAYAIALIVLYKTTPIYQASSTILLKGQQDINNEINPGLLTSGNENFYNEKRVITSPDFIKEIISRLNYTISYFISTDFSTEEIDGNDFFSVNATIHNKAFYDIPFEVKMTNAEAYELSYKIKNKHYSQSGKWGESISNKNFSISLFKNISTESHDSTSLKQFNYSFEVHDIKSVVAKYKEAFTVKSDKDNADVIEILLKDEVENKAIRFLDTLSKVYIENDVARSIKINENTLKYIEQQSNEISAILSTYEADLERYKSQKIIYQVDPEYQRLSSTLAVNESQKSKTEFQLNTLNEIQNYLSDNKSVSTLLPLAIGKDEDSYLATSLQNLYKLLDERKNSLYNMTEKSSNGIDYQINTLKQKIINYISEVKKAAYTNTNIINAEITKAEEGLKKLPKTERELLTITRKIDIAQDIYVYLLKRKSEIMIEKGGLITRKSVIESPFSNGVISPVKGKIIGNYLSIAFAVSALIILTRKLLYGTINTTSNIVQLSTIPLVGIIPKIGRSQFDYMLVNNQPKSIYAESFRHLSANIEYLGRGNPKTILVTSFMSSEGKTFNAISLASTLAKAGHKTLLLDMDLHRPQIHKAMNITNNVGIINILKQEATIEEGIQQTVIEHLDIILSGTDITPELITSPGLKLIMDELRLKYDYIIIDTPPIIVSDVKTLMKYSDINICIIKAEKSRSQFLEHIDYHISKNNLANMGFVFNENKYTNDGYSYNYGYNYGEERKNSKSYVN